GAAYLTSLIERVPSASSAGAYAKIVEDKAILRQLIKAGNDITQLGYQADGDVDNTLDRSEQAIYDIANRRIFSEIIPMKDAVNKTFKMLDRKYKDRGSVSGLPTGYTALDSLTTGFQPSDLIILAARPSMGKTALALNIAEHVATEENKAVGIFSLEMSAEQLVTRMLCSVSKVDAVALRKGFLSEQDWDKLFYGMDKLSKAPILIVDSPGISTLELRAKARRMQKEHNLELIIVDYLQLMAPRRQRDSKVAEVSEMSRDMKILARELKIPVLVLSQLSRAVEQRTVKRPQLSDLRESGAIEQDADVVLFIYREDYYKRIVEEGPDEAEYVHSSDAEPTEIGIAKQRNGPTGRIKLTFLSQYTRFENYEGRGEML
ncbi:MAG: replicative DNA helicase, partial [bacterium]